MFLIITISEQDLTLRLVDLIVNERFKSQ